ncbi:hypothetical protein HYR99_36285 [Candidatus Poribacteria bacterium]|nr:hypothetical protein [Candidatus Poribacteria bacterium]
MKKLLVAFVGLSMVTSIVFAEQAKQETEFVGTAIYYKPGQDDDYDNGFGAEAQARFWLNPSVGLALSLGAASYQINEQEEIMSYGLVAVGVSMEGDVTLIPLGGSILFRPVSDNKLALTLEAGIRYVIVDSQAKAEIAAANAFGDFVHTRDTIKIDNGVVGVVGANIEGKVSPQVSLLAGLGYQFDIVQSDAKWMGEDLGDNELKALLVKAGIVIRF